MATLAVAGPVASREHFDSPCVLWVDDDPHIASGLRRLLRRYSVRLLHAYDGMQGYWMAASQRPDVVITDLKMPKWPGMDFVECVHMNDELRGVPLIVVSGHETPADRHRLRDYGVQAFIQKPFLLEELLAELRKFMPLNRK